MKDNKKPVNNDNAARMQRIRREIALKELQNRKLKRIPAKNLRYIDLGQSESPEETALLRGTIENHSLLQPLSVCGPFSDGTYKIVDGIRRFNMIMEMSEGENVNIPCYVVGGSVDDDELKLLQLAANMTHRNNSQAMVFAYIELFEIRAAKGLIPECCVATFAASNCNITPRHARDFQAIWNKGSSEVIDAVNETQLPVRVAATIVTAFPENKEKQNEEAVAYLTAPSKKEAKARLDAVRDAAKTGRDATVVAQEKLIEKLTKTATSALGDLLSYDLKQIDPELLLMCCQIVEKYAD